MLRKIATELGKNIIRNEVDKRLSDIQKSIVDDVIKLIKK